MYLIELRAIAKNCQHEEIPPEILRDRIVLGIRDDNTRERLPRYNDLTLQKAVNLIKAAEQTEHQVKLMRVSANVNALKQGCSQSNRSSMPSRAANNKHQSSGQMPDIGKIKNGPRFLKNVIFVEEEGHGEDELHRL